MAHRMGTPSFLEYAFAAIIAPLKRQWVGKSVINLLHSFKEVMTLAEAEKWKAAGNKEMASLKDLGVYTLVPSSGISPERKLIGTK